MFDSVKLIASRLVVAAACALMAVPGRADMQPTINLMGNTGLIDMPTAEQQPDGYLTLDHSKFGPILRNSLHFQITPRLSGTFRYTGIQKWSDFCTPNCAPIDSYPTYYDRAFDLSYQILKEGKYLPAFSIGLQDFVGTGIEAGEYMVATKTFADRLKVTAGVGFGRLGSSNSFGQPFGPRPATEIGKGGNVNYHGWFKGDAAVFGGLEYQINDKWTAKVEYSSDAYREEVQHHKTFERNGSFNYGLEYAPNDMVHIGGYYMYGSTFGVNLVFNLNLAQRPAGAMRGPGPEPVAPRPSQAGDPSAWSTEWTSQADAKEILIENMTSNLEGTGIAVESLGVTEHRAQIRFRSIKYDAEAQAVGRVARAMSQVMPASVEVFEIVPVENGLPAAKVTIRRSDLEHLEFAPDAGSAMRAVTEIAEAGKPLPDTLRNPELYPKLTWSLLPFVRTRTFDPRHPLQAGVGLRFAAQYELTPGLILAGSVTGLAISSITNPTLPEPSVLQHVRSDASAYDVNANPGLETLTGAYYTRLAPDLFGRVTAGYLERMFAGVSTEVLYRPVNRRWALGIEADYVAQRDTNGGTGLNQYDYRVALGHVSGYYDLGGGYHAQIDLGKYLAGDIGGTLTVSREFANGWKVGAFATKTNVSAKEFGEGSFDKGIFLTIPLNWFTGVPSRYASNQTIRPIGRDGGAQLDVNGRLYDVVHSYDAAGLDSQWGRFWK